MNGQVLLAERWAAAHPAVKVVTCHPGWILTDGVEAAYGNRPAPSVHDIALLELSVAQSCAPSLRISAVSWRNAADGRSWRRIQIGDL